MEKKVFIGVGHGGGDSGSAANGYKEKDITLKIAKYCEEYLKAHGVSTKLSRYKDENDSVEEEVRECNAFDPDLAIDDHINAGGGDGFEAYYSINGGLGKTLAENIEEYVKAAGQNSRGVKTRKNSNGKDYYYFIRGTKCPAVICELGFIDNKTDLKGFDEEHELKKYGEAYAKGILKTLGLSTSKPSNEDKPDSKPTTPKPSTSYYKAFNSTSIVDGLKGIGVDSSFNNRKKIAKANGISNYEGTSSQNEKLLDLARQGKLKKAGSSSASKPSSSYYKAFKETSIVDGLKAIGVDSSFENRKKIAKTNGISNYEGTATQNEKLLSLARQGKLKKA